MIITASELANIQIKQLKLEGTGFLPDPDMNQLALEFINQHWRALTGQMIPTMASTWQKLYVEIANRVFERIPFRLLMP